MQSFSANRSPFSVVPAACAVSASPVFSVMSSSSPHLQQPLQLPVGLRLLDGVPLNLACDGLSDIHGASS